MTRRRIVPPGAVLPQRSRRASPYLYFRSVLQAEMVAPLAVAVTLPSPIGRATSPRWSLSSLWEGYGSGSRSRTTGHVDFAAGRC